MALAGARRIGPGKVLLIGPEPALPPVAGGVAVQNHRVFAFRGRDPIMVFRNLIERITTGRLYESTKDKIDHLDCLLDGDEKGVSLEKTPIYDEILELKSIVREMRFSGGGGSGVKMREFNPEDAAKLLVIDKNAAPNAIRDPNRHRVRQTEQPSRPSSDGRPGWS